MPKRQERSNKAKSVPSGILKGWQQIAAFLGEPASVVQRWASEGMPLRRQGRYVETTPDELNAWRLSLALKYGDGLCRTFGLELLRGDHGL